MKLIHVRQKHLDSFSSKSGLELQVERITSVPGKCMDPRCIEMSLQTPLFVVFMGHSFQGIHGACPLKSTFDCFVIE